MLEAGTACMSEQRRVLLESAWRHCDDIAAHCGYHTRGRRELERGIHIAALGVYVGLNGCQNADYSLAGVAAFDNLAEWNGGEGERFAEGVCCLWRVLCAVRLGV